MIENVYEGYYCSIIGMYTAMPGCADIYKEI